MFLLVSLQSSGEKLEASSSRTFSAFLYVAGRDLSLSVREEVERCLGLVLLGCCGDITKGPAWLCGLS